MSEAAVSAWRRCGIKCAAVGLAAALAGCSSLRHLSSEPPGRVIELKAPITIKRALGQETTLPAGEYRATLEDNGGYYYQAAAKVIGNDTVGTIHDGGLYVSKRAQVPTHYYVIQRDGVPWVWKLRQPPAFEFK